MSEIIDLHAREILDSRGNPTLEAEVLLEAAEAVQEGAAEEPVLAL